MFFFSFFFFPERPECFLLTFGWEFCSLAYAELFIFLATLVRCFGDRLELFETDRGDVEFHHDAFIPAVKPDSKGVRVLVK